MRIATAGLVIGAALLVGGGMWLAGSVPGRASGEQRSAAGTTTVPVERRDVESRIRVNGTLGYANANQSVLNQAHGTITAIAAEGSVVQRGKTLYEIDGQPVILLYGDRPAWRTLALGVSDGPDVKQLEENLIALGYASRSTLSTDGHFTSADVAAIKRWQKAVGLPMTGFVDPGRVVFLPGAVRVGAHQATIGSAAGPGSPVMNVSSTTRVVTVELDANRQTLIKVGDPVQLTLPNSGKSTTGKVSTIASVAKTSSNQNGGSQTTVTVTISLDDPTATGSLDQAPVRVAITSAASKGVLAVPINALLALSDGTYAVEVDRSGKRQTVRVKTGLFDDDDGLVEVSGEGITQGTRVVVPA